MTKTPQELAAAISGLLIELATINDRLRWTSETLAAARRRVTELQAEVTRMLREYQAAALD